MGKSKSNGDHIDALRFVANDMEEHQAWVSSWSPERTITQTWNRLHLVAMVVEQLVSVVVGGSPARTPQRLKEMFSPFR
jgi:hypothetical protein